MAYGYEKYCGKCGALIDANSVYCPKCGTKQTENANTFSSNNTNSNKLGDVNTDWLITVLLCFFVGALGVHRFYHGKIGTGILMLLTGGGLGIWYIIDLIFVIIGRFTDKNGNYITIN